jgi:hypothetical protein
MAWLQYLAYALVDHAKSAVSGDRSRPKTNSFLLTSKAVALRMCVGFGAAPLSHSEACVSIEFRLMRMCSSSSSLLGPVLSCCEAVGKEEKKRSVT